MTIRFSKMYLSILGFVILAVASTASAQSRCAKAQPLDGCVRNFAEIDLEQKRVDAVDPSLKLKPRILGIFQPINNKLLVMNFLGRHELTISYTPESITTTRDGKVTRNAKICYRACPGENQVSIYHAEYGTFQAIPNGLQIGRYKFYIE